MEKIGNILSWCPNIEASALQQATELSQHPSIFKHVALMPDAHLGKGMPIGGVIACSDDIIPNAVGVDIGCSVSISETNLHKDQLQDKSVLRAILNKLKPLIPTGAGSKHQNAVAWDGFEEYLGNGGNAEFALDDDRKKLQTLGGGNHFGELQYDEATGKVYLMFHSGSRNLGFRICEKFNKIAQELNRKFHVKLPNNFLAFLPVDSPEGREYLRDMNFAMRYAKENHRLMQAAAREVIAEHFDLALTETVVPAGYYCIHHNYAALENHFGHDVWVHRKGATCARDGQLGLIPGSMGTASYIVRGRGNALSFHSCSHGAGRRLGRTVANSTISLDDANASVSEIVCERFSLKTGRDGKKRYDVSECPLAYKDIDAVIENERDLIEPLVRLRPIMCLKD